MTLVFKSNSAGFILYNLILFRSRQSSFDISKESAKVTDTTALAKATLADLVRDLTLQSTSMGKTSTPHF